MTNNETKTQKTNNKNNKMKAFGLGIGLGLGIPLLALTTSTIVLGVTKNNNGGTGGTDDGGYSETKWVKYTKSENFSKVDEITPKMMEMISNNVISYEPDKDYSNSSIYNKNLIADANNNVLSNPNIDKIAESAIGLLGYIGINMYENNKWEFPVTFNYGNELKINNGCVLKGSAFGFQVKDKNDKVVVEFKLSFTDDCNTYMVSSVKDALGFGGTETGYIVLSATEDRGNKAPVLVDAYYPDKGEAVTSLYDTAFPVFFSNTTEQGRKLPSDEKEIIIDESKKIPAYNNNNNVPLSDFVTLNPNNDVFDFNDISFVPPPKEEWDDFEITGTNELKLLNSDDTWAKHSKTANTSNDFRPRFLACAPSSVAPDITNSLFITMLGESIFKDLNFGGLYEFGLTIEDFPNVISPIQTLSETEYTCGYIYDYTNKKWLYTGFWAKLQQLKIYQISTVSTSPTVVTLPLQPSIAFPSYGGTTIIDLPEDATVTMVGYFHPDDIKLGSEEDQLSPEELESDTTGKKKTDINQACKITAGEAGTTITFTGDTGYSSELKQFTVSLYGSSNRVEANAFVLWKYERPNYETYYSLTSINIYQ